ncbi:MAG: glycosyltransferase, partial [Candidatus Falkowbacteria bacterium]|nr:glycosyltransferase [Candidatus Falkowbacteria bacterium]
MPYFIESIKKQDYPNVTILLVDNSEKKDNPNSIYLKNNYPEIEIIYTGENTGFARANNLLITRAKELSADYFVSSNIDAILEKNVVLEVLNAMIKNHQAGSATCKIKKWDFEKKDSRTKGMTNFIDSVGISITEKHQFFN